MGQVRIHWNRLPIDGNGPLVEMANVGGEVRVYVGDSVLCFGDLEHAMGYFDSIMTALRESVGEDPAQMKLGFTE